MTKDFISVVLFIDICIDNLICTCTLFEIQCGDHDSGFRTKIAIGFKGNIIAADSDRSKHDRGQMHWSRSSQGQSLHATFTQHQRKLLTIEDDTSPLAEGDMLGTEGFCELRAFTSGMLLA